MPMVSTQSQMAHGMMQKVSSTQFISTRSQASQRNTSVLSPRGCTVFFHGEELKLNEAFLEDHPGGREIVESFVGRDITREFEEAGHSTSARKWARRFAVAATSEATGKAPTAREEGGGRRFMSASRVGSILFDRLRNEMQGDGRAGVGAAGKQTALLDEGLPLTLGLISIASAVFAWHLRSAAWN